MARDDLLFLAHRIPYPPNKGDKIRAHAVLMHLAKTHRVHLGCHVDDPADLAHGEYLAGSLGGECMFVPLDRRAAAGRAVFAAARGRPLTEGYFGAPALRRWVGAVCRRRGIVRAFVFGSAMAPLVLGERQLDPARSLLDMVDVDSDKWRQYAQASAPPRSWLYRFEADRLARLERRAAARFRHTVLVSPYEAATFAAMAPESAARIHSIGNGVDLTYFDPRRVFMDPFPPGLRPIVMTGQMDYRPNSEAAAWFAAEVLPRIRRTEPRAHFFAVGANPPPGLARGLPHVTVTGRVEDVRPYLAHADIAVAPLRIARGLQNKVLEAMAMAKPVVATTAATRALTVVGGRNLLVADRAEDFAEAVLRGLDAMETVRLGCAARAYVERHHTWPAMLALFDALMTEPPAPDFFPPRPPRFVPPEAADVQ